MQQSIYLSAQQIRRLVELSREHAIGSQPSGLVITQDADDRSSAIRVDSVTVASDGSVSS